MPRLLLAALVSLAATQGASAQVGPFKGNDTGGIIAWQPGIVPYARTIAADHCAQYGKLARITSVRPWYGDYIGFTCSFPRTRVIVRDEVILRRAY